MSWAQLVLLLLLGAAGLQTFHYYPTLPPVVASHFGANGVPNGWSSREAFFGIYWGVVAVMMLAFYGLPVLLRRLPVSLINIPHRDYWLAPERREASLTLLTGWMHWFGNCTVVFMVCTIQLVIEANQPGGTGRLANSMWLLLVIFLAVTAGAVLSLYRNFPRPR